MKITSTDIEIIFHLGETIEWLVVASNTPCGEYSEPLRKSTRVIEDGAIELPTVGKDHTIMVVLDVSIWRHGVTSFTVQMNHENKTGAIDSTTQTLLGLISSPLEYLLKERVTLSGRE